MKTTEFIGQLQSYFYAEKKNSILILFIGWGSVTLAYYFYNQPSSDFLRGVAIPLLVTAIVQLASSMRFLIRVNLRVAHKRKQVVENRSIFLDREISRLQRLNKVYFLLKAIEVLFIVCGILCFLILKDKFDFGVGVAMGFAIQSCIMLGIHYFAELRAAGYLNELVDLKEYTIKAQAKSFA